MDENCETEEELEPDLASKEANLIWDEYKYRHTLCWSTVFKLTSAAVLLGVIPYLDTKLPNGFLYSLVLISPPILAVVLIRFGMLRIDRELNLLDQIKKYHRKRQRLLLGFFKKDDEGSFDKHVRWYLRILIILAAVNVVVAAMHLFKHSVCSFLGCA